MVKFSLPIKNLPYYESQEDRPSFYNCASKTFEYNAGIHEYYGTSSEIEGNFIDVDFTNANIKINVPSLDLLETYRQMNHCRINFYNQESDTTPIITNYYFIKSIVPSGTLQLRYYLVRDVYLTYGPRLKFNPEAYCLVGKSHEDRFEIVDLPSTKDGPLFTLDENTGMSLIYRYTSGNNEIIFPYDGTILNTAGDILDSKGRHVNKALDTPIFVNDSPAPLFYLDLNVVKDRYLPPVDIYEFNFLCSSNQNVIQSSLDTTSTYPYNATVTEGNIKLLSIDTSPAAEYFSFLPFYPENLALVFSTPKPTPPTDNFMNKIRFKLPENMSILNGISPPAPYSYGELFIEFRETFDPNAEPIVAFTNVKNNTEPNREPQQIGFDGFDLPQTMEGFDPKPIWNNGTLAPNSMPTRTQVASATLNVNQKFYDQIVAQGDKFFGTPTGYTSEITLTEYLKNPATNIKVVNCGINGVGSGYFSPANTPTLIYTETQPNNAIEFDGTNKSYLGFTETLVSKYQGRITYTDQSSQALMRIPPTNFSSNSNYANWFQQGENYYVNNNIYAYALIPFLANMLGSHTENQNNQNVVVYDTPKAGAFVPKSPLTTPYIICPLSAADYGLCVESGSPTIAEIIVSPFPLINDDLGNNLQPIDPTFGTFFGLSSLKGILLDDVNTALYQNTESNQEVGNIGLDEWTMDMPIFNENGDHNREIKIYCAPHFKGYLLAGTSVKELTNENLHSLTKNKRLEINVGVGVTGRTLVLVGRIQNGGYPKSYDLSVSAYINETNNSLPNTSSNYTSYLQNNMNTLNTSQGALGKQKQFATAGGALGMIGGLVGGVASGVAANFAKGPLGMIGAVSGVIGGISGIAHGAVNVAKANFEYDKGMREIESNLMDRENNSMGVENMSGRDNASMLLTLPMPYTEQYASQPTILYANELTDFEKISVAQVYHREGYNTNQPQNFSSWEDFAKGRMNFNFGEIDSFRNIIDNTSLDYNIGEEVKTWFDSRFKTGIRLGNYYDVLGNEVKFLGFDKENWETSIHNGTYRQNKRKEHENN